MGLSLEKSHGLQALERGLRLLHRADPSVSVEVGFVVGGAVERRFGSVHSLGLLAHLRFEDGWGGCQGDLTTEREEMGQEP